MKQLKSYLSTLVLVAVLALTACSSEEYTEDPAFEEEIVTQLMDKSELPKWLADYINYLEYAPNGSGIVDSQSGIFRFEWDHQTYYELSSPKEDALHKHLYTAQGTPVKLMEEDYKSLSEGARNWTIVYLFKPTDEKPIDLEYPASIEDQNVRQFFTHTFPSESVNNGIYFGQKNWDEVKCYIVNSPSQLKAIYTGNDSLPDIDFDKYSLVIGRMIVPDGASFAWQELTTKNKVPALNLYYEKTLSRREYVGTLSSLRFFWGLYPKLPTAQLTLNLMVNHQLEKSWSWTEPEVPPTMTYPIDSWEVGLENMAIVSEAELNENVYGHGWRIKEKYEINDDGTVDFSINWSGPKVIGGGIRAYEFNKDSVTTYSWADWAPAHTYYQQAIRYAESDGMIYFDSLATFQVLSVSKEKMEVVTRQCISSSRYGGKKDVFFYMIFTRMSDEETLKMREDYWIKSEDLGREMTKEDLWHEWVLMEYSEDVGNGYVPHKLISSRKSSALIIRFLPDGNVEGNYYDQKFKGTYEYDGKEDIKIIQVGMWPQYFIDFTSHKAKIQITYAAYLYLNIGSRVYLLVRSAND